MKHHIKRLLTDSFIYGISGVISSLISIFLIPLYTRIFEPAEYGVISILVTTSALFNILLIFGLDNSVSILYWDKTDTAARKQIFNNWFWATLGGGLFLMIFLLATKGILSKLLFGSTEFSQLFLLLGFNMVFVGFQKITNTWCRLQKKPVVAMMFSLLLLLFTVGLNILFILNMKLGIEGVFLSQVIVSIIGFLAMVWMYWNLIDIRSFSFLQLRTMVTISLPLVPSSLMFWIMNMASVYFLNAYLNRTELGYYQLGASVANVLSLVTWAFFQAWTPFALEVSKQEDAKRVYSFILEVYCVGGLFCAFTLMLISQDLLAIFTQPEFFPASTVMGLLGINVIIIGIPNILSIANNLTKSNSSYAIAVFLGAATTLLLFLVLIPMQGKVGAAIAMITGNIFVAVYLGVKAQKLYPIPYPFGRIASLVFLEAAFFSTATLFNISFFARLICAISAAAIIALYYHRVWKKRALTDKRN